MARVQFFKFLVPLFLSLCLLVPLIQSKSPKVKYCDKHANYDVKVSKVEISPDPVIRGKPATFKIYASTGQPISGGKIVIDVAYYGVHVHNEDHELCEETSCPVSEGDFVISHSQTLPSITPPGSYTLKLRMEDGNHQLTCVSFGFSIRIGASEDVASV